MSDPPLTEAEAYKLKIIEQTIAGERVGQEAARLLFLSERQIKRLKRKVKEQGALAVVHKLKNKPGNHQVKSQTKKQVLGLINKYYSDFKPSFAAEKLAEINGILINPETLRLWMIEAQLWKSKKQKAVEYRAWRDRKEYFGELQQFDGSYHLWFENRLIDNLGNPMEVCLLAAIDDASGKITYAKFGFNEGVVAVFNFWKEYVEKNGKPLAIYLDRFSTYKINHKMAVDNIELMTQFQKAMSLFNIKLISANSPQGKGRIERLFLTLQDRLIKELRLANINTIEEGNRFLAEVFLIKFNTKFSVIPERDSDIHRALTQTERLNLNSVFSQKSDRRVNNDFTVQFKNHFYQLKEIQPITIRAKDRVNVEEWLDETLHFKIKDQELNCFVLPQKPKKIVSSQPTILTNHPLNWKPPANHPWRVSIIQTKKS